MADPILVSPPDYSSNGRKPPVSTSVYFGESGSAGTRGLTLPLTVTDRDVIDDLERHSSPQVRDEHALAALRIGCITLRQVQSKVDTEALRQEGDRLISDLQARIRAEATQIQGTLSSTLKEYFDPQGGKFHERVERLIRKDGDLESLL